jgi:hypothetical protein
MSLSLIVRAYQQSSASTSGSTWSIPRKSRMQPVLYSTSRRTHQFGIKHLAHVLDIFDQVAIVKSTPPRKRKSRRH